MDTGGSFKMAPTNVHSWFTYHRIAISILIFFFIFFIFFCCLYFFVFLVFSAFNSFNPKNRNNNFSQGVRLARTTMRALSYHRIPFSKQILRANFRGTFTLCFLSISFSFFFSLFVLFHITSLTSLDLHVNLYFFSVLYFCFSILSHLPSYSFLIGSQSTISLSLFFFS